MVKWFQVLLYNSHDLTSVIFCVHSLLVNSFQNELELIRLRILLLLFLDS